jgi:hypothetical protein
MEELNEDLSALFFESVWFSERSIAESSFNDLMDLVNTESKKARVYNYYDEFGKNAEIEIVEVKRFADAVWNNLISGEWKARETPKELWIAAYNSTSN